MTRRTVYVLLCGWVLWSVGNPTTATTKGTYMAMPSTAREWYDLRSQCEGALKTAQVRRTYFMGRLACLPAGLDPDKTDLYRIKQ